MDVTVRGDAVDPAAIFTTEQRGLSRIIPFDVQEILREPPNKQAGLCIPPPLQELTQSPINATIKGLWQWYFKLS